MAESNSPRLGLRRWSAGTDTPARVEFDTDNANLDNLVAIDKQDTFANRPAAGVRGTYFWDTTNSLLWRDNASAWSVVGSNGRDGYFRSSATNTVPLTVDTPSGQTANLFEAKVNGTLSLQLSPSGTFTVPNGGFNGRSAALTNIASNAANPVLSVKGATGQSGLLISAQDVGSANQFSVSNTGVIASSYFRANTTSTLNAASSTSVANMANWSGVGSLEVRSNASASGMNDFVYFKHAAISATAATRRFGLVMKVGDEDATGATRSAAIFLRSTAADFDTPELRIDVRDQNVWAMDPTNGSTTPFPVYSNGGYLRATPSGTGGVRMSNVWLGTQNSGNDMYFRAGGTGNAFRFYAGGVHSDSAADAGAGGVALAALTPSASMGLLTTGRINLTDVQDAELGTGSPTLMIGAANAQNLIIDNNEIISRNNGAATELLLQARGGSVFLGDGDSRVHINGRPFYISVGGTQPPNPQEFDIWLDARVGEGLKRRVGSSWVKINP